MTRAANLVAPRGAGLRAQQKASTRVRLKEAAMDVFAAKGYSATTVEDIASAAGASPATFYLHFKRKIDVLTETVEDEAALVSATAGRLPSPGEELDPTTLRQWVERLFDSWQVLRIPQQVLSQARLIEPELHNLQRARFAEGITYWEEFLDERGMARGKHRRAEAALLNSLFVGLFEIWIISAIPLERKVLTDHLADLLWRRIVELSTRSLRAV